MGPIDPWFKKGALKGRPWTDGTAPPGADTNVPPTDTPIGTAAVAAPVAAATAPVLVDTRKSYRFNPTSYNILAPTFPWLQIVAANDRANYLLIQNQDAANSINLYFGTNPQNNYHQGIIIVAGGYIEFNVKVPTCNVYALAQTAGVICAIMTG